MVSNFQMNPMTEFLGNSVSWFTSNRGESIDTKSQNPDLGFPEGRLHQTERAGIFHITKDWTLILDSPQGVRPVKLTMHTAFDPQHHAAPPRIPHLTLSMA